MKKNLTLFLLFICTASFAQKVHLQLNLKKDSTYYMVNNANLTITEDIKGAPQNINTLISATVAHKVISVKDTIYEMEVKYLTFSMHMKIGEKQMNINSTDTISGGLPSKLFSYIINRPFLIIINKNGKILDMKNTDNIYKGMFDKYPEVPADKREQFMSQMKQSFGDTAYKDNFQDAFAMFPNKKVGVNDTWYSSTVIRSIIALKTQTNYILEQITNDAILINGNAVISSTGTKGYKQMNGIPMRIINATGTVSSKIKLDKNTGWIIKSSISKMIKNIVEIPDSPKTPGGLTFPMTVIADITIAAK